VTARVPLVPQVVLARVLSGGGPYREHDILSLAFVDASLARLVAHREGDEGRLESSDGRSDNCPNAVPDAIVVEVLTSAEPHTKDDRLVLSFLDPQVARVVSSLAGVPLAKAKVIETAHAESGAGSVVDRSNNARAVLLFQRWSEHEARRFIAVVDKLFTVERLGWHRHALAMRLLLPDNVVLLGPEASVAARSHLEALRAAANETLNAPLLAAFMPQFSADAQWLASIETPALIAAASELRNIVEDQAGVAAESPHAIPELTGSITPEEWMRWGRAGTDVFLALLLPSRSRHPVVAQRLSDYRAALLELFGQMDQAPAPVRLKQMTQSNPLLDDRLWNLAGGFQDAWGVNAVA